MDLTRLVRISAALPVRAAAAGVELATMPLRGAASVASSLAKNQPPARIAAEFFGATPSRRCWRGRGRAWIEVRGLDDSARGRELGAAVLAAVRAEPGVASAVLNYPLSRLVVSFDGQGPGLRALSDVVGAAEKRTPAKPRARSADLPGDAVVLAGRMVAVTANAAGLCVAAAGRALPWPRLPLGVAAPVIVIDYQPRLRRLLENRFGPAATDTALAVATAAAHTLTLSPSITGRRPDDATRQGRGVALRGTGLGRTRARTGPRRRVRRLVHRDQTHAGATRPGGAARRPQRARADGRRHDDRCADP